MGPDPTPAAPAEPIGLGCLRAGYGDYIERVEHELSNWFIIFKNGTRLVWDDGKPKTFEERLASQDLEDQFAIPYPKGKPAGPPAKNDDPGRVRVEALFKAVYGADRKGVSANLVEVDWLPKRVGKKLRFNRQNGAAEALTAVSLALDERLPKNAIRYISEPAGTFNWRHIAGTDRLSAHSFGVALDINVELGDYWRWETNGHYIIYKNRIPDTIVEVFEEHGFIWGGKWYHFDTLHFEYRPELLKTECLR
jgi:peptidoglycan L-alanyl-D-glutamate endopeptidase CwlK